MSENAVVKNAGDEGQVESGKKKERFNRKDELNDIKFILSTKQGRRFIWRILSHCRVFESIWHQSAMIHYNSGIQDTGHFVLAEIIESDKELYLLMQKENMN